MKTLRTKQDVLDVAAKAACSAALAKAIANGTHTSPRLITLPWGHKGFAFTVTSQSGHSVWSVCVEVREAERKYRTHSRKL